MVETYVVGLTVLGAVTFLAALLPEHLEERPVSPAIVYVALGAVVFGLPLGLPDPDPLSYPHATERLAEFVVIVALLGAGLKLDRVPSLSGWATTWRLLAVTMPLTVAAAAALGWWVVGLAPAAALLLGAALAPTDPVLASTVQVEEPHSSPASAEESSYEMRFALTSEAGLNDGLAFPVTYAAIAVAAAGLAPGGWVGEWLLVDVVYRIAVGVAVGYGLGRALAPVLFRISADSQGGAVRGIEALGLTLVVYGAAELFAGYGFIAVFVAALSIRHHERTHEYNRALHDFAEAVERLALALLLVLFGGAIATGLLSALTPAAALVGLLVVFAVRPLAGLAGLVGSSVPGDQRLVVAFFGIRGVASVFYLAYALNSADVPGAETLWSLVGLVVVVSVVVHGVSARPVVGRIAARHEP